MDAAEARREPSRVSGAAARAAAVLAAIALVLAGIWITGGLITDDFRASMALTAVWFAAVVAGAVLLWRRAPALRPAAIAAVATFVVVGAYLGYTSTTDTVVDETVATGPAELSGSFRDLAHPTTGTARIVARDDGSRVVTFTGFETDPGPDLFVYAVPGATSGEDVDGGTKARRPEGERRRPAVPPPRRLPGRPAHDRHLVPRLLRLVRRGDADARVSRLSRGRRRAGRCPTRRPTARRDGRAAAVRSRSPAAARA